MRIGPQRPVNPDAIVAPQGYRVEALITGLTFPSAISFGPGGEIYLAESGGVAGSVVAVPRVLRIDPDQSVNEIGRLNNPIVGLVYRQGELLIAEDGAAARILRVTAEGEIQVLVEGLPGGGDYGLSGLALDQSGGLLFGLGTRTNSGVVGLDNLARGWVSDYPEWADVPGADVELVGVNYVTSQPTQVGATRATTGSFQPFGNRCDPGDTVSGVQRCGGAVYRMAVDQAEPERLAWGLRNPVGVTCGPDGRIFATEAGMEERGSRPIAAAPDNLWEIQAGAYYGWPDHASGVPVTEARFRLPGHPQPRRLLANAPTVASLPLAQFAPRSGASRLDFSSSSAFGYVGEALVALAGEWSTPAYANEAGIVGGYRIVRVDPRTGQTTDFLVNRQPGPASLAGSGGLERPFDVRFDPTGEVLYVVDMGEIQLDRETGLMPFGGTGVLWRITRIRPTVSVPPPAREAAQTAEAPEETGETDDLETDDADDAEGTGEEAESPMDLESANDAEDTLPAEDSAATEAAEDPTGPVGVTPDAEEAGSDAAVSEGSAAQAEAPYPEADSAEEAAAAEPMIAPGADALDTTIDVGEPAGEPEAETGESLNRPLADRGADEAAAGAAPVVDVLSQELPTLDSEPVNPTLSEPVEIGPGVSQVTAGDPDSAPVEPASAEAPSEDASDAGASGEAEASAPADELPGVAGSEPAAASEPPATDPDTAVPPEGAAPEETPGSTDEEAGDIPPGSAG